jgi:hypothetical protein
MSGNGAKASHMEEEKCFIVMDLFMMENGFQESKVFDSFLCMCNKMQLFVRL